MEGSSTCYCCSLSKVKDRNQGSGWAPPFSGWKDLIPQAPLLRPCALPSIGQWVGLGRTSVDQAESIP